MAAVSAARCNPAKADQLSTLNYSLPLSPFSSGKVWNRLWPDKLLTEGYNFSVSVSEIIKELPKLTEAERRAVCEGLLEIANQDADVALCNQTALDGALMFDRMEDEDARRQSE